jgi:NOL1/NOP2/fmu family ribosome biogenesis protein/precorrin-6B methylase 2
MAVTLALDPQPGERILDLAAAPGGKATHIAARLAGRGTLYANEIHPKRVWDLAENLERWGARNVVVLNETPARLADRLEGCFDRVLLDAPCSGEGLFRKNPAARAEWSPALVEGCARRQDGLLDDAAQLVRPGGVLVYSTCTFAAEEDEGVIARFLEAHPDYEVIAPARLPGFEPGRPEWIPGGGPPALARTIRLWPHVGPGEGHFIAVLRRGDDSARPLEHRPPEHRPPEHRPPAHRPAKDGPESRAAIAFYHAFCRDHLDGLPAEAGLSLVGTYLYATPEPPGLPGDLRAVHPGWWLGVVKAGRFEPSHALAMALTPAEVRLSLALRPEDPRLGAFLLGQGFADAGDPGWVLMTVDGFPVGWGKRAAGVLKSRYPKGLRRPAAIEAPHE